jgi:UDP-N-acetylglucosamine 3-dehydrogenase
MVERLVVAIVGCGWAGSRHARAYRAAGAVIRWCIDLDRSRAEALTRTLGQGEFASDYRRALDDPRVDAVSVCLPHHLHADVSSETAAAGKHVLCEKPVADTLANADRMIDAADQAGVILMVAENERFNPIYHKARELLQDGVIGRPALLQMNRECYLNRSFLEERRWFLDAHAAAGGIMMSGGVHDFETMRMLLGEVTSVYALRARQRFEEMEGDDTSIALVRFADGTVGTLVESFCMKSLTTAAGPEVHTLRIDGDLGHLAVVDPTTIRVFSERADYALGGALVEHSIHVPPADTFALEIAHFMQCIRTGDEPITSGRLQRRPLELVLAAYRSMETGRPARIPPLEWGPRRVS